ncbi:hypothetical protein EZV73_20770 [Acidaminobacter sp. JC074]|uniref:hypothetical protein n=1 Tax=Acidaminobacter sp. JC074 TaxID=2530199 RepID=UPI001F0F58D8|nr:hypothetical protein [Acidaminobacter sp. JC074]MCH4890025.1 hypothetical protein [Acidaminobacter sp. JC074]
MKKHVKSQLLIGLGLIALSILLHYVHVLMFHDVHHTMIFLVADIAFVPLEVFFVTMVLDKILEKREKAHLMEKLSMLVGLFYTKLGQELLEMLSNSDKNIEQIRDLCQVNLETYEMDFKRAGQGMKAHKHRIDISKVDLIRLKSLLDEQEPFLVNMISNPALLEHDTFSDLLLSLFHLREELEMRKVSGDQSQMKDYHLDHLRIDLNRAYRNLSIEWVDYMKYLKEHYPFLYVTAIMKNPYDQRQADEIEVEIMNHYYKTHPKTAS